MFNEQQLAALLDREIECLEMLLGVLKQEHDALINADIELIERATITKNHTLAAQAEAIQARQNMTMQSSFGGTTNGLLQLIPTCENQEELSTAFSRLSSLTQQCQTNNRANGRLIQKKQEQARGALDVIRQTDHVTPTYSGQGKTTTKQDSRSLGKA
jgi:flagellar biosynthesis/type III secretory pathway chaperone